MIFDLIGAINLQVDALGAIREKVLSSFSVFSLRISFVIPNIRP